MSVVRIRESPYYRGVFLKEIYENFPGTLELSVIERCPYREVRLYSKWPTDFDFNNCL